MSEKVVWVLTDDRAGNVSQCMGVAEALGQPFAQIDIAYTKAAKLPNALMGASLMGLDSSSRKKIVAPWPDLVISAGRRTAPVARYIKQASASHTKLAHIMNPGKAGAKEFDLIFVPAHDQKKLKKNQREMVGAPHRVSTDKLDLAQERWASTFATLSAPRIALIVGGATKNREFTTKMAKELGKQINQLAKENDASLLVTTSRRTGEAAPALLKELHVPSYCYKWGDESENPYYGYLACADSIIVTADSVSMCSEACAAGKPVAIYAPDGMISPKHQRMVKKLVSDGYAELFTGKMPTCPPKRLNTTEEIAAQIQELLK